MQFSDNLAAEHNQCVPML